MAQAHVEWARAAGYGSVGHTAMLGNDAVLRSLQKLGFRVHSTLGPERFNGVFPGLTRLVLDLQNECALI
ncbi:hypothetical protein ACRAWG_34525 [Methylobacterium sp. P31]